MEAVIRYLSLNDEGDSSHNLSQRLRRVEGRTWKQSDPPPVVWGGRTFSSLLMDWIKVGSGIRQYAVSVSHASPEDRKFRQKCGGVQVIG